MAASDYPSIQELQDAKTDINNLEAFANSTGTFTTRIGDVTVKTIRQYATDFDGEISTAQAWASETDSAVITSPTALFSAKEYAQGSQSGTGGSAKAWASAAEDVEIDGTGLFSARHYAIKAQASLDNFEEVYLGQQASDPTVDLNGDPLDGGEFYLNTTSGKVRVYNGVSESWADAVDGATLGANNTWTGTNNFTGSLQQGGADVYAVGDTVPISDGGTGATTAAGARGALAVPGDADDNAFTGVNTFSGTKLLSDLEAFSGYAVLADGARVQTSGRTSVNDGGGGVFIWRTGDQSANVTADAQKGIWVPPSGASTGASGAWQRLTEGDYNARWFGVLPGNSGSVNQTALQAAVDYIESTNAELYIPSGLYLISGTVTIDSDDVGVYGDGGDTILAQKDTTDAPLIDCGNGSTARFRISVRSMRLVADSLTTQVAGSVGLRARNVEQGRFEDLETGTFGGSYGSHYDSFIFDDCIRLLLARLSANGSVRDGCRIVNDCIDVFMDRCDAQENGDNGFYINDSEAIQAVNCTAFNNTGDGWEIGGSVDMRNCVFTGCVGDTSGEHNWNITYLRNSRFLGSWAATQKSGAAATRDGWHIVAATAGDIRNCQWVGCFGIGGADDAFVFDGVQDSVVTGCHARGTSGLTPGDGFNFANCTAISISGNTAEGCAGTGFLVASTNNNVAFSSNVARSNGTDFNVSTAISGGLSIFGNPNLQDYSEGAAFDNLLLDGSVIENTADETVEIITSADPGARIYRDVSAAFAATSLAFSLQNSVGSKIDYAKIIGQSADVNSTTENGALIFQTILDGSLADRGRIDAFSGNWAFGKSSASYKVDVAGDVNVDSGQVYRVNGTQVLGAQGSAIADLNQTISNPPTQAEVQAISDKVDAILAMIRTHGLIASS